MIEFQAMRMAQENIAQLPPKSRAKVYERAAHLRRIGATPEGAAAIQLVFLELMAARAPRIAAEDAKAVDALRRTNALATRVLAVSEQPSVGPSKGKLMLFGYRSRIWVNMLAGFAFGFVGGWAMFDGAWTAGAVFGVLGAIYWWLGFRNLSRWGWR